MGEKDIFISYSWNCRKEFVNKLYNFLTQKGLRVWKDDEEREKIIFYNKTSKLNNDLLE